MMSWVKQQLRARLGRLSAAWVNAGAQHHDARQPSEVLRAGFDLFKVKWESANESESLSRQAGGSVCETKP